MRQQISDLSSSRRRFLRNFGAAALLGGFALATPFRPARAQDWKALRSSGALGERYDGFLVARDSSAASVAASVNKQRRDLYIARAAEQGTTVDQVGRIYFQENLSRLPNGTWVLLEDGSWVQK
ncbi:MAG: DUF1318 domain-containing protein [Rhodovibrionaceae bacterium]